MSTWSTLKRLLVGKPIATKHAHHERLPIVFGLPVFASDALSSVAYASEEILLVLVLAASASQVRPEALLYLVPISLALIALLWIVVFSYVQTIQAYPQGGGSYRVSSENLGPWFGLVAGAALLIGYVLTVAVSVSAGAAAIVSMAPDLQPYGAAIASAAVLVLMVLNLRGAKESGIIFAVPTYSFVVLVLSLVAWGFYKGTAGALPPQPHLLPTGHEASLSIGAYLLIRAFAAGCTALTGTEAIADGVQAFKPPEARNASRTLLLMAGLLTTLVLGISWSAQHFGITPMDFHEKGYRTVVAQIAFAVWGEGGGSFAILTVTAMILFLAANTGFADFPRLSQFIARDGYLPRQLTSVGDKLVYQNGIILLAFLSIALILLFNANTHSLIPLYAAGVFLSFTLSQSGMVAKWVRARQVTWKTFVSGFGAVTTGLVTLILLVTRFVEGAYILLIALSVMMLVFWGIRRHYLYLANQLTLDPHDALVPIQTTVLLLAPRLHRGILQAIAYAKSMAKDCRAIHVTLDPATVDQVKNDWNRFGADIPLVILESPYRSLIEPITDYIDQYLKEEPDHIITVIVPQAVPKYWWQGLLHNNAAIGLKLALRSRKNVVITNMRYFLK